MHCRRSSGLMYNNEGFEDVCRLQYQAVHHPLNHTTAQPFVISKAPLPLGTSFPIECCSIPK